MARYSEKSKQSILMPPESKAVSQLFKETGIKRTTVCQWRKKASFQASFTLVNGQNIKNKLLKITLCYTETHQ